MVLHTLQERKGSSRVLSRDYGFRKLQEKSGSLKMWIGNLQFSEAWKQFRVATHELNQFQQFCTNYRKVGLLGSGVTLGPKSPKALERKCVLTVNGSLGVNLFARYSDGGDCAKFVTTLCGALMQIGMLMGLDSSTLSWFWSGLGQMIQICLIFGPGLN